MLGCYRHLLAWLLFSARVSKLREQYLKKASLLHAGSKLSTWRRRQWRRRMLI